MALLLGLLGVTSHFSGPAWGAQAQLLTIKRFELTPDGQAAFQYSADTNSYYILKRGDRVTAILLAKDLQLGVGTVGQLTDPDLIGENTFYLIEQVPLSMPRDSD